MSAKVEKGWPLSANVGERRRLFQRCRTRRIRNKTAEISPTFSSNVRYVGEDWLLDKYKKFGFYALPNIIK